MDKITYLRKTKEKINEEYLEKLHGIDEIFKSDNVQIVIYVEKNTFNNLCFDNCEQRSRVDYDLKSLLRGKLIHPSDWFISRCPKCGCYLYYPKYNPNFRYTWVCANCFEERTLERLKAINFPTEKSGQLVNYKYYTVAGTMNRNELEQFMRELGNEKYCNEILRGIDNDLNILELCDTIDSVE